MDPDGNNPAAVQPGVTLEQVHVDMMQALQAFHNRLATLEHAGAPAAAADAAAPVSTSSATAQSRGNKPPKPEFFKGRGVREWVEFLNNYFSAAHEPEDSRRNLAVSYLRENALLWWQSLSAEVQPDTWGALSAALVSYFAPLSATMSARDQLARTYQRASVKQYTEEFKRLLLAIPDINEAEKMDRYRRGLKTQVRLHVTFANPTRFEDLCLLADQIDSIVLPTTAVPSLHSIRTAPPEMGLAPLTPTLCRWRLGQ